MTDSAGRMLSKNPTVLGVEGKEGWLQAFREPSWGHPQTRGLGRAGKQAERHTQVCVREGDSLSRNEKHRC